MSSKSINKKPINKNLTKTKKRTKSSHLIGKLFGNFW